ncbi:MAG: hypothetical protein WBN53_08840, partial [Thermodesulfobacteriota bacterium]
IIVQPNPHQIFPCLRGGMETMKMTVLMKLKEYLEKNRVRYEVGYHERVILLKKSRRRCMFREESWPKWSW